MKVAIVHDYIKEYGGAERVLETLLEVYPDAEVYSLIYLPSFLGPHRERFSAKGGIHTSFLQYFPFKSKLISPFRIIAPLVFKSFDFSKFDVVIVSQTGAYTPNMINKKGAAQICYSHTPPRYLYGYATAREWKNNLLMRIIGEISNHILRMVDFRASQNVDYFIANSENVARRIKKFYRRDAKVIYPPVSALRSLRQFENSSDASTPAGSSQSSIALGARSGAGSSEEFSHAKAPRAYYLAGGRIARPKHIDLIVKTFEELNLPLKVFGRTFGGAEELKSKSSKIEFLGEVSEQEKYELMKNAKAFIFASEDEDFGITPVEAMALGTPVIAYRSGGVLESVIDPSTARSGQAGTGIFFDKLTVHSLSEAIQRLNDLNHLIKGKNCIKHAQKFSKERFKKEIFEFINRHRLK